MALLVWDYDRYDDDIVKHGVAIEVRALYHFAILNKLSIPK